MTQQAPAAAQTATLLDAEAAEQAGQHPGKELSPAPRRVDHRPGRRQALDRDVLARRRAQQRAFAPALPLAGPAHRNCGRSR